MTTRDHRRRPLLTVTLWRRDPASGPRSFAQAERFRCGRDLATARRTALQALPLVETTRYTYHRDTGRADYAEIRTRDGDHIEWVNPEVRLVPSVGDLGWTP